MAATQRAFIDSMETYRSVTRPVIYDSIMSVLKYFRLDGAKDVLFNGDGEVTRLPGSNFGSSPTDELYTDGTFRNKVYAVAQIEESPFNTGYHNQRRDSTEAFFFNDPTIGLNFSPEFMGRAVTVELNTHFTSRVKAQEFVNRINYIRDQLVTDFTFDGIGHLPVNLPLLDFISDIHKMLVKNQIRKDDLLSYFEEKSLRDTHVIQNEAGNHNTLVFPVKLRDYQVQFNDPEIKLAQKGEIFGQYEASFSYSFFYNEFIGWRLNYPLHIHQDQIPDKWVTPARPIYHESVPYQGSANPEYVVGVRLRDDLGLNQAPFYLVLPAHDNWEREFIPKLTPVIQVRLMVTEGAGEQLLCNIFEIPDFQWNDETKAYILRRHDKAFLHHDTPFLFQVYSDDLRVEPNQLRLDETGNVYITRPPTTTRLQRLMLNYDYDVENYSADFWKDVRGGDGPNLPDMFPGWDWDKIPDDWKENAPGSLPIKTPGPWNNYMMELDLIVKNIKDYTGEK